MLAPGVPYEMGGLFQQQAAFAEVFAVAPVAEFILLLSLYERIWPLVIIVACLLLSTAG